MTEHFSTVLSQNSDEPERQFERSWWQFSFNSSEVSMIFSVLEPEQLDRGKCLH